MSNRIRDNTPFLRLLLSTHFSQQKALLDSASDEQLDLLTELLYNILYTVPIPLVTRKKLQRKKYLKDLARIKRSRAFRRKQVRARKRDIIKLLIGYAKELNTLM